MKILILASNPRKDLNLDREIRDLREVIEKSHHRQQLDVEDALAVRVGQLQDLLFRYEPQIVHFCGHGGGQTGLVFEGSDGSEQWVRTDALRDLFRLFSDRVGCVLLNACYSEEQANEIVRHIDYVIGMNQEIRDDAAIAFSKGFYRALGYGCSIEEAYEFGCNAIQLEITGSSVVRSAATDSIRKADVVNAVATTIIPEHLKPTLKKKQSIINSDQWRSNESHYLPESKREELQWELAQEIASSHTEKTSQTEAQPIPSQLLTSQNSLKPSGSYRRRFTQLCAGSLIICLLSAVGFYGYRYWQNYRQWQQEQPAQSTLQQAKELANQNLWESAIITLNQISPNSIVANQIPLYLNAWSAPLLKQAKDHYEKGDLSEAIRIAKAVPSNSSAFQDAQTVIQDWTRNGQTLEEIKRILNEACDRPGAETLLQSLKSPGLQKQAKDLIGENERKCPPPPSEPPAIKLPPAPSIPYPQQASLQQAEVEPVFRKFISAWNNKQYIEQLELIAKEDFTSVNYETTTGERYAPKDEPYYDYASYAKLKEDLAAQYEWINVEVSNEQFIPYSDGEMLVRYHQHYSSRSPKYESWGTKELYFRRKNEKVEIYREIFYRDRVRR